MDKICMKEWMKRRKIELGIIANFHRSSLGLDFLRV